MLTIATQSPDNSPRTPSRDRRAVKRLPLLRKFAVGVSSNGPLELHRKAHCACGGGCPRCQEAASSSIGIGDPHDRHEEEADQVAARVMREAAVGGQVQPAARGIESASASPHGDGAFAPPAVEEALNSPGQALDPGTRAFFEPRLGRDFGDVRVHTDGTAAASARAVHAHAYTLGNQIVFNTGQYRPQTEQGQALLAHELTHVVQQRSDTKLRIQRAPPDPDPDKDARCKDLLGLIRKAVEELIRRADELLRDPLGLQWDNWTTPKVLPGGINVGSVVGHQEQYENWVRRLGRLLSRWDDDDCNSTGRRVTREEREWVFKQTPVPIPRPRPDTTPEPWAPPGAHRFAAAARGAAIGATAGLVLGGIIGAIGGAGGGTLVAPGVGTIGGGAAGALAGAEAGASAGAGIGTAIGGFIGWLTD